MGECHPPALDGASELLGDLPVRVGARVHAVLIPG